MRRIRRRPGCGALCRSLVSVSTPRIEVEGCRRAHVKLATTIAALTDDQMRLPSLLPDWTVGHVLSHIARNADGMSRRIEGAMRDETVDQYVGGKSGRAAEIEAGTTRTARVIVADVMSSSDRLDALFAAIPESVWAKPVRTVGGSEHPVAMLPLRRWREVEVHLVDLGLGVTPADWSSGLVDIALPRLVDALADRCDQRALMAWALGRGPAPELRPWG